VHLSLRGRHTTSPAAVDEPERDGAVADGLIRALEASDRFRRDGRLGSIFHPGRVSFRELSPQDSLHIIVKGDSVSAHVDEVSPLRCTAEGDIRYSPVLVVAHNVSGFLGSLGRRLRGVHGSQRCSLGCEMVWVDDEIADLAHGVKEGVPSGLLGRPRNEACPGAAPHEDRAAGC